MKRLLFALSVLCLLTTGVNAGDDPVDHRIIKFYDSSEYSGWSVIELELRNKGDFLKEVVFFCQLKNSDGYAWRGESVIRNVIPGESRKIRVAAEGGGKRFSRPTSAKCKARLPSQGHYSFVGADSSSNANPSKPPSVAVNDVARAFYLAEECDAITLNTQYVLAYSKKSGIDFSGSEFKNLAEPIWREMINLFSRDASISKQEACFVAAYWQAGAGFRSTGLPGPFHAANNSKSLRELMP